MLQNLIKGMALVLAGLLAACGGGGKEDRYVAQDVEILYNLGKDQLGRGRYRLAAAAFDEVERQHPYSIWAGRAQLMAVYAHYQNSSYDDAILAAERYITLNPGRPSTAYAYYLIALCNYEQIVDVGRDQSNTDAARSALIEVIRRYPDSDYARDAKLKLDLTEDHLAGKDMEVGRFYMKRQEYIAALGRFEHVINDYQTTSHVPEALHRMVEAYLALGIYPQAEETAAILGHNFPGSKWYGYTYDLLNGRQPRAKGGGSFLSSLWPF